MMKQTKKQAVKSVIAKLKKNPKAFKATLSAQIAELRKEIDKIKLQINIKNLSKKRTCKN